MDSGIDENTAVSHAERAPSQILADNDAGDGMARSPLFTPEPEERTASPPRMPSPVVHLKDLNLTKDLLRPPSIQPPQPPPVVAHGLIQHFPLAGTYSSLNSARNKVAQQCGLSVVPARHKPTREGPAEAPPLEEGHPMPERNVDVRSSLDTLMDDARFSNGSERSAQ